MQQPPNGFPPPPQYPGFTAQPPPQAAYPSPPPAYAPPAGYGPPPGYPPPPAYPGYAPQGPMGFDLDSEDVAGGKSPEMPPGKYILNVGRIIYRPSRKGGGNVFIFEFDVAHVFSANPGRAANGQDYPPVAVGDHRAWVTNDKHGKVVGQKVKQLFVSLWNLDWNSPKDNEIIKAMGLPGNPIGVTWNEIQRRGLSAENPFAGYKVGAETTAGFTAKAKNPMTFYTFYPVKLFEPPKAG
jgi:hypothetical protein